MIIASLVLASVCLAATGPPFAPSNWELDFEDEFETLNKTIWYPKNGTHSGNAEKEFYTPEQCSIRMVS